MKKRKVLWTVVLILSTVLAFVSSLPILKIVGYNPFFLKMGDTTFTILGVVLPANNLFLVVLPLIIFFITTQLLPVAIVKLISKGKTIEFDPFKLDPTEDPWNDDNPYKQIYYHSKKEAARK